MTWKKISDELNTQALMDEVGTKPSKGDGLPPGLFKSVMAHQKLLRAKARVMMAERAYKKIVRDIDPEHIEAFQEITRDMDTGDALWQRDFESEEGRRKSLAEHDEAHKKSVRWVLPRSMRSEQ